MFDRGPLIFVLLVALIMAAHFMGALDRRGRPLSTIIGFGLLVVVAVLFIGLRPVDTPNDTFRYVEAFDRLYSFSTASQTGTDYFGSTEPFFWYFAYLIKFLGGDAQIFLICAALFSTFLFLIIVKNVSGELISWDLSVWLTALIFCTYSIVYMSNHLRASISIPLSLIAFVLISNGRLVYGVLIFIFATGFHNSVFLLAPVLLFAYKYEPSFSRKERISILLGLLACAAFSSFAIQLIQAVAPGLTDSVQQKIDLYSTREFEIKSVYTSLNFWFIVLHVSIFLIMGYRKIHIFAFYILALALLLSPIPILSDRYFAYVMPLLPVFLYLSLTMKLTRVRATLGITIFYTATAVALINTGSVAYNLGF